MDFNIYRKNASRIDELTRARDALGASHKVALQISDWQFFVGFADETLRGYVGIKDAVIAELEKQVAVIDNELSSYGLTFNGQQNLPLSNGDFVPSYAGDGWGNNL